MIDVKNVSFAYRAKAPNVLNGVSCNIQNGDIVAILGLNGSGKSTLIKLLVGLAKPESGEILYGGENLNKISYHKRSKLFAYVSQKHSRVVGYSVREYLSFGMSNQISFYEFPGKEEEKRIDEITSRFHIEHLVDKRIDQISGGERQLVAICSALLQNSESIILDEPTSALDYANQRNVLRVLKEISKEGKTIILSTHNPNHALFLDSKVLLLDKGRVAGFGESKDIITLENLQPIYGEGVCLSKDLGYQEISFRD